MRIALFGNSGSGKTTLARILRETHSLPMLDLDTVAWEPGQIAVPRAPEAAISDVRSFCSANEQWIVEGCYGTLIESTLKFRPVLVFLDPGEEQCLQNCRQRPFEPHKYATPEAQDSMLQPLLTWVSDYYRRDGEMSHRGHLQCFEQYAGSKVRLTLTADWMETVVSLATRSQLGR